jgi:AraC-like DNA-binding protein/mannose-6-phosphate isomerase-like protein (cupin superfamily)
MVRYEKTHDFLRDYNGEEVIYKFYHELVQKGLSGQEILAALRKQFPDPTINWRHYWMPEVYPELNEIGVREMVMTFEDDIKIATHTRFHPPFVHTHQFFEIIYVIRGCCTNNIGGTSIEMNENSICIIPPVVSHSIGNFDDSVMVNILVKKAAFDHIYETIYEDPENLLGNFIKNGLDESSPYACLFFPDTSIPGLTDLVEQLINERDRGDKLEYPIKKALLYTILAKLSRIAPDNVVQIKNTDATPRTVYSIKKYLEQNYRNATLSSVAKEFHYSVPYLSKIVHQYTGITFGAMLRDMRMTAAAEKLTQTNLPLGVIADQVGINTASYFSKTFYEWSGMTPREYRKKHYSPLKEPAKITEPEE